LCPYEKYIEYIDNTTVRSVFSSLRSYKWRLMELGKQIQRMSIGELINKYALVYMTVALLEDSI
jgi:hypothetical protein